MNATKYREICFEHHGRNCHFCDSSARIIAHHIDGDSDNNEPDNLLPVCASCHDKLHNDAPQSELTQQIKEYRDKLPEDKCGGVISKNYPEILLPCIDTNTIGNVELPANFDDWQRNAQVNYLSSIMDRDQMVNFLRQMHGLPPRESHELRKKELAEIAVKQVNRHDGE